MHKATVFFLFIFFYITITAQKQLVNDPHATVRSVNQSFTAIYVTDGIDLYISQSDEEAIAVSASTDAYKDAIKTVVENGDLKIYFSHDKIRRYKYKNKKRRVYVSFKKINVLQVSGASDVFVAGNIISTSFKLDLSETSVFKGTLKADTLSITLGGASDAIIKGTAVNANIDVSGASDVLAYDLSADTCNIKASGASDVYITANKMLNVYAGGTSNIRYKGNAVITQAPAGGSGSAIKTEK